jgi:predicted dinucleotide-binding enzyme
MNALELADRVDGNPEATSECVEAAAMLRQQAAEIESLRKDADRWQWAKVFVSGDDTPEANARIMKLATQFFLGIKDVDSAIDAAMKGTP